MLNNLLKRASQLAICSTFLLAYCQQPDKPAAARNTLPHFQFSTAPMLMGKTDTANWCKTPFTEAIVINADPTNYNRRLFMLNEGAYRVIIRLGTTACSFILRKKDATTVEVFTSNNFPMCLADHKSFLLSEDGTTLGYGDPHINFPVNVLPTNAAGTLQIALEFPPDSGYGMMVYREVK